MPGLEQAREKREHENRAEREEGNPSPDASERLGVVRENESVYLPLGCVHRLENPGKIPLTLIEVQSGSYLGEDDIVRIEDTYGRV